MFNTASILHAKIATVCPIDGVAIGDPADQKTWRIDFATTATAKQMQDAQSQLAAITPTLLAQADAIIQAAQAALVDPLAAARTQAINSLPTSITPQPAPPSTPDQAGP